MTESLLDVNNIEVVYDQVFLAISGLSLQVPEAGSVALLGANGAGKSTTLKAISGLLKPERGEVTRGTITFRGDDLLRLPSSERVEMGIVQVLEERQVFEHLTPDENLLASSWVQGYGTGAEERMNKVYEYFPQLADRREEKAGYLSGGEQQMLVIGRALMTEPELLMLDEPSLGLAPRLVEEIFEIITRINRDDDVGILLVEQNTAAALEIVDYAYLLENGSVVMDGSSEELKNNPDIQEFYLGGGEQTDFEQVKHYRRRKRWLS